MRWPWQKPVPPPPQPRIRGVYCTIHTAEGDFNTGHPYRTDYNGARMTMFLDVPSTPFSGPSDSLALHWGANVVELHVVPPVQFHRGARLTVLQPIEIDVLMADSSATVVAVKP